jgi:PAS domain S-box-containing protein
MQSLLGIIDEAAAPIAMFDAQMNCIGASAEWEKVISDGTRRSATLQHALSEWCDRARAAPNGHSDLHVDRIWIPPSDDSLDWLSCLVIPSIGADAHFHGFMAVTIPGKAPAHFFESVLNSIPQPIFVKDARHRWVFVNDAYCDAMRRSRDDIIGKSDYDVYEPGIAQSYWREDDEVVRHAKPLRFETSVPAGGTLSWYLKHKRRLEVLSEVFVVGMNVDITEQKRAQALIAETEARRLQSEKMEALGTLAGGIAHDFNNLLSIITSSAVLAMDDLPPDHPGRRPLAEINKAAKRASELVRRILIYTRQGESRREPVDLSFVVDEAMQLIGPTLPRLIDVESHLAPGLPAVMADATAIHQVMINLLSNAAHAMEGKVGRIVVTTEEVRVEHSPAMRAGRYVGLSVADTGNGMDRATLERAFDPFYTTKPPGQGTGLGLSIVLGVVRSHGGDVKIDSAPGRGTVVALYFPPACEESSPPSREELTEGNDTTRDGSVLYVDDEEALVFLTKRLLGRLGYRVTGCTDPKAALIQFEQDPDRYDIVITDLSMPGMSGFHLAESILRIRHDMPVILVSGYVAAEQIELAAELGVREVIMKPDTVEDLALAIDRALQVARRDPRANQ